MKQIKSPKTCEQHQQQYYCYRVPRPSYFVLRISYQANMYDVYYRKRARWSSLIQHRRHYAHTPISLLLTALPSGGKSMIDLESSVPRVLGAAIETQHKHKQTQSSVRSTNASSTGAQIGSYRRDCTTVCPKAF